MSLGIGSVIPGQWAILQQSTPPKQRGGSKPFRFEDLAREPARTSICFLSGYCRVRIRELKTSVAATIATAPWKQGSIAAHSDGEMEIGNASRIFEDCTPPQPSFRLRYESAKALRQSSNGVDRSEPIGFGATSEGNL
jgi:hypothetical protein